MIQNVTNLTSRFNGDFSSFESMIKLAKKYGSISFFFMKKGGGTINKFPIIITYENKMYYLKIQLVLNGNFAIVCSSTIQTDFYKQCVTQVLPRFYKLDEISMRSDINSFILKDQPEFDEIDIKKENTKETNNIKIEKRNIFSKISDFLSK